MTFILFILVVTLMPTVSNYATAISNNTSYDDATRVVAGLIPMIFMLSPLISLLITITVARA
jgi:hypothetical protein